MYILAALMSAFFLSIYEISKKKALVNSSVYETLFFYCFGGFLLSLMFVTTALSFSFVEIMLMLLKSTIIFFSWTFITKSVDKLDVSVVAPFGLFTTVLVIIFSSILFDEKIGLAHILSMTFIGGGILLLTKLEKYEKKKIELKYIIYLLIGTSLSAISALMDKHFIAGRDMSYKGILFWFFGFLSLFYLMVYIFKEKKCDLKKMKTNYWLVLAAAALFTSDIAYYTSIGMVDAKLSIISILKKLSVVISTILASVFLKEKHLGKKLLILLLMLLGVAMPVLF